MVVDVFTKISKLPKIVFPKLYCSIIFISVI